jgi:mannose-6-phosphate isomerase-like protein (cupin superfamily)
MITFIDTAKCQRVKLAGSQGEFAEIINKELCGAEDFVATLRWLNKGDQLDAEPLEGSCQLIYLMEGEKGIINLEDKDYEVTKGAGVFLDIGEQASVKNTGSEPLKLLHLVVPEKKD